MKRDMVAEMEDLDHDLETEFLPEASSSDSNEAPDALETLNRDLRRASSSLNILEARFLVDYYYQIQKMRIRAGNQVFSMVRDDGSHSEPHEIFTWTMENSKVFETQIQKALDSYSLSSELGLWARSIKGIGPVITAGLLAHIDIEKAGNPSGLWRFAGYDPTSVWSKGEKRPWNARLKTLCWKIGESFVKVKGRGSYYGEKYTERREEEDRKNLLGHYEEIALNRSKKVGKSTEAYKYYSRGKLPPGHMYARVKRWTVKLFLSHYFEVGYEIITGEKPEKPWIIALGGHQGYFPPPGWERGKKTGLGSRHPKKKVHLVEM